VNGTMAEKVTEAGHRAWRAALTKWRESVGLSQAQLARDLGVSAASVSQWESGTRQTSRDSRDLVEVCSGGAVRASLVPSPKPITVRGRKRSQPSV